MRSDCYFTVTSWFLGNVRVKLYFNTHSGGPTYFGSPVIPHPNPGGRLSLPLSPPYFLTFLRPCAIVHIARNSTRRIERERNFIFCNDIGKMKRPLPDNGQKTVQKVLHHLYDMRKLQRSVTYFTQYKHIGYFLLHKWTSTSKYSRYQSTFGHF